MSLHVLPCVYPVWDSLGCLDLGGYISFLILGKFSTIISSNVFSCPFRLSSSSETPMIQMLGCLMLSQRSMNLASFLKFFFSLFCSASVISTIFQLTYQFFFLIYSIVAFLQDIFNLSYCIHVFLIHVCSLFIFLIHVCSLFIHASILF